MILIIICESHTDHEKNGQHRKHKDPQCRKRQQGLVKIGVQKRSQNLPVGRKFFAASQKDFFIAVFLNVQVPDQDDDADQDDRQQTKQKNQETVVAIHSHPAFLCCLNRTQCRNLAQVFRSEEDHIEDKCNL